MYSTILGFSWYYSVPTENTDELGARSALLNRYPRIALLLRIPKVPGSVLGPALLSKFSCGFPVFSDIH
jgi:hypothetical protein